MSLLKAWKKQVLQSPLVRIMRIYWKVFFREEHITIGYRWERLAFLERLLKKKLSKKYFPLKVWLFCVEKKEMFNPFTFVDDEKYIETLRLQENYIPIGYRHKKVCSYKKPIRG